VRSAFTGAYNVVGLVGIVLVLTSIWLLRRESGTRVTAARS
jgi:hypothetical protein